MFPAESVALLRSINARALPHSAIVEREQHTKQTGGAIVVGWTPDGPTLPCRLVQAGSTPQERLTADAIEAPVEALVVFDGGARVHTGHRLRVSGVDDAGVGFAVTLEVVGVSIQKTGKAMHKVYCQAFNRPEPT